ncbi:hypothetical protein HZS_1405 [Henneguya salminicola]|nr:hypothetical protein HZS_1405 [Henneguya salminicola]
MTMHGDLYYEGKEFEVKLKQKKPGDISDDLRISLGMPVGVNKYLVPPPWLIAMQRYGPPPSYPNLKIQGLNAPIPEGATFGYHAGGWGKPPVDELGRPLYGDVFGTNLPPDDVYADELEIDKSLWGELEYEPDNATESDEEMEDVATLNDTTSTVGTITPYLDGLITPSITTVALSDKIDVETLQHLELRKRKADPKEDTRLYSVIPTKKSEQSQNVVGTSHTYDMLNLQDEIEEVEMELDVEPPTMPESPESIKKTATSEKHQRVSKSKKKDESKSKKNKEFKF